MIFCPSYVGEVNPQSYPHLPTYFLGTVSQLHFGRKRRKEETRRSESCWREARTGPASSWRLQDLSSHAPRHSPTSSSLSRSLHRSPHDGTSRTSSTSLPKRKKELLPSYIIYRTSVLAKRLKLKEISSKLLRISAHHSPKHNANEMKVCLTPLSFSMRGERLEANGEGLRAERRERTHS